MSNQKRPILRSFLFSIYLLRDFIEAGGLGGPLERASRSNKATKRKVQLLSPYSTILSDSSFCRYVN